MSKEAMKLALEAFKEIADETYDSWTNGAKAQRIAQAMLPKLEEVLAKQEQGEPKQEEYLSKAYRLANELRCHLAIAPAPQQRKPLTDEQIEQIRQQPQHHKGEFEYKFDEVSFARAIEAAHGIKE
jgi:hypothetical protein